MSKLFGGNANVVQFLYS